AVDDGAEDLGETEVRREADGEGGRRQGGGAGVVPHQEGDGDAVEHGAGVGEAEGGQEGGGFPVAEDVAEGGLVFRGWAVGRVGIGRSGFLLRHEAFLEEAEGGFKRQSSAIVASVTSLTVAAVFVKRPSLFKV